MRPGQIFQCQAGAGYGSPEIAVFQVEKLRLLPDEPLGRDVFLQYAAAGFLNAEFKGHDEQDPL